MTKVIYAGKDIARDVEIVYLRVQDSCGDQVDAIDAVFTDSDGQWSGWAPQKGDTLEIEQDGYRSGVMWIDKIKQDGDRLAVGAVSLPPDGRTKRSRSWEQINLPALAAEIGGAYGLQLSLYGLRPAAYARVDQLSRGDFGFLQERARLEGATMKLTDGKLVLYDDAYMESQPAVKVISAAQFCDPPEFTNSAGKTYSRCILSWQGITGEAVDPDRIGPVLSVGDVPLGSIGEAQRFAKNLLQSYNKRERSGSISVLLDVTITGGNVIGISGMGMADGNYFIELAEHDFAEQITRLTLHRCRG